MNVTNTLMTNESYLSGDTIDELVFSRSELDLDVLHSHHKELLANVDRLRGRLPAQQFHLDPTVVQLMTSSSNRQLLDQLSLDSSSIRPCARVHEDDNTNDAAATSSPEIRSPATLLQEIQQLKAKSEAIRGSPNYIGQRITEFSALLLQCGDIKCKIDTAIDEEIRDAYESFVATTLSETQDELQATLVEAAHLDETVGMCLWLAKCSPM